VHQGAVGHCGLEKLGCGPRLRHLSWLDRLASFTLPFETFSLIYGVKASASQPRDPMRGFVLFLTLFFAVLAAVIKVFWGEGNQAVGSIGKVAPIGLARLAMVMAALWIAWPVVRKPAMWLPPGALVLGLIALGACVVQPRLAIALVPAASALIAFAAILRFFRGK